MPQKALITGVTGQTGSYLAQYLLQQGVEVHGTTRSPERPSWRLKHLGVSEDVQLHGLEGSDPTCIKDVASHRFDNIYHLAAESSVANSLKAPTNTAMANIVQTTAWLEAIRNESPECHFFNAVSSEVLAASDGPLGEDAERSATNPYAVTKLASMNMAQVFRESFGLYVVNGLLFNHESELRDTRFVTSKIIHNLCRLANDTALGPFDLGNVLAERDFSHAEDFAEGIAASLQYDTPQDYVFASGTLCSVRDFFDSAASQLGFTPEWVGEGLEMRCLDSKTGRVLVGVNPEYYRPVDELGKTGNTERAQRCLNWQPKVSFADMIGRMITYQQSCIEQE